MQPFSRPEQVLYFLRSFDYTWIFAAPRREIVPDVASNPTHFVHKIHITSGWDGNTAPLCQAFTSTDYHIRRLWTPVMDERNLCTQCRTLMSADPRHLLARCTDAIMLQGRIERRGDDAQQQQIATAAATIATMTRYFETSASLEEQRITALRTAYDEFRTLGIPVTLPAPLHQQLPQLVPQTSADVQLFIQQDDHYLQWKIDHQTDGYIANIKPGVIKVHRADCKDLQGETLDGSWTEGSSQKMVALRLNILLNAIQVVHRTHGMSFCEHCRTQEG